jgi:hypothetical protein
MFAEKYQEHIRLFLEAGIYQKDDFVPIKQDEIKAFEDQRGISLPSSYRDFLLLCGKRNPFFLRIFMQFPEVAINRKEFEKMTVTTEAESPAWKENLVVFGIEEESKAFYLFADGSQDPVCYESDWYAGSINMQMTFSEFFCGTADLQYARRTK